jgi:hypothetical protein
MMYIIMLGVGFAIGWYSRDSFDKGTDDTSNKQN